MATADGPCAPGRSVVSGRNRQGVRESRARDARAAGQPHSRPRCPSPSSSRRLRVPAVPCGTPFAAQAVSGIFARAFCRRGRYAGHGFPTGPIHRRQSNEAGSRRRPRRWRTRGGSDRNGLRPGDGRGRCARADRWRADDRCTGGATSLGSVRITHAVKANGERLAPGTYTVRLTAEEAKPEVKGQTPSLERWVEFLQGKQVKGREVVTIVPESDIAQVSDGKRVSRRHRTRGNAEGKRLCARVDQSGRQQLPDSSAAGVMLEADYGWK